MVLTQIYKITIVLLLQLLLCSSVHRILIFVNVTFSHKPCFYFPCVLSSNVCLGRRRSHFGDGTGFSCWSLIGHHAIILFLVPRHGHRAPPSLDNLTSWEQQLDKLASVHLFHNWQWQKRSLEVGWENCVSKESLTGWIKIPEYQKVVANPRIH